MTNGNDPAFSPRNESYYDPEDIEKETASCGQFKALLKHTGGLTKREEFAKAAMQGLCAIPQYLTLDRVRWAIAHADALIAELNKEDPK